MIGLDRLGFDNFAVLGKLPVPLIGRQGTESHTNRSPNELRLHINMSHSREIFFDPLDDELPEILVSHFATTELKMHFDLIPLVQEILGMPDFGEVVVLINIDAEFDLLDLANNVLLFFFLLGEIVAELTEVHDPTNGRLGVRGDLDQIHSDTASAANRLVQAQDAKLFISCCKNHAHFPCTDSLIDANILNINSASSLGGE